MRMELDWDFRARLQVDCRPGTDVTETHGLLIGCRAVSAARRSAADCPRLREQQYRQVQVEPGAGEHEPGRGNST
jgi:hypothetical protein